MHLSAGVRKVADHPTGGAARAGADTDVDEISTLAVRIVDRKSQGTLFSGTAKKEFHSRQPQEEDVSGAVAEMLASIPSSGTVPPVQQ